MKTVHLSEIFGNVIMIRNAVSDLFSSLGNKTDVIFDFIGINFISRSAAHEYLRHKANSNIIVKEKNLSPNVKAMFLLVARQLKKLQVQ